MIVVLIHLLQLVVLQLDDVTGVASRIEGVRSSSQQLLVYRTHQLPVRVLVGPLHLVENDTLQLSLALTVYLEAPSFLPEIEAVQKGVHRHVEVNLVKIAPVCSVGRSEGIGSEVVACPGVHVGVD